MRLLIFILALVPAASSRAAVLYSNDYDITDLGRFEEVAFSTDIPLGALSAVSTVEIEMTHSYVGELVLTLRSPDGQEFRLLDHDGARTRVGAGNGLLSGVELYTLRDPNEAGSNVVDWDFTGYQPGGTYGAREWPSGSWEAGTWNLELFNDDVSFAEDGVVGTVTLTGLPVPEPCAPMLVAAGAMVIAFCRKRSGGGQGDC